MKRRIIFAALILCADAFVFQAPPLAAQTITVNWSSPQQTIDGFGAAAVDFNAQITDSLADFFFTTNGIGLSILRLQIVPDYASCQSINPGNCISVSSGATTFAGEPLVAQQAAARGVNTFFASSWSPPASMKSNGVYGSGGNFIGNSTNYTNFASILASYVPFMASYGITINAISPQNEPDISQSYQSALWTAQQFHDFIPYLYSALSGTGVKIMFPENSAWSSTFDGFAATTMNDSSVAPDVGLMAQHGYAGDSNIVAPANYGLHLWQTEDSSQSGTYDGSMSDALGWAQKIHNYMSVANANAFVWWFLTDMPGNGDGTDNAALTDINGNIPLRAYVTGNWSKFVRPGWHRVAVTTPNGSPLLVTAFENAGGTQSAVVVVNNSGSNVTNQTFAVGAAFTSAVPWITSSAQSLQAQTAVSVSSGSFTYTIPADSVVTFSASALAATTTSLTGAPNPATTAQSVTFTATVSPVSGTGTPTGMVTFSDGSSSIGTGTLTAGVATFATQSLAVGNHTVTASYGGDTTFATSTGSLSGNPEVINKNNSTTTVTSSVNPTVFGQSVTFTATVSPAAPGTGTPTGTVAFLDGGTSIGTGTLSGGVATFATSALAVGNHTITTTYGGDADFSSGTGSLAGNPQVVNKAGTATTVTSSVNPTVFGQSVIFTATVSPAAPGAGAPTGTVTFLDGGTSIGSGTLSGGVATFTTSALAVGNHTITTTYAGSGNFSGGSGSLTGNPQVVNEAGTATTVTSSVNPTVFGQSVIFTATVSPAAPGAGTATGTVTFLDGGTSIGSGTLSGGVATFSTSALAVGNHTITTTYAGSGNFSGGSGSLTGNPQVVNKAGTATVVTSSQNPSSSGQSVTFTATVSPAAPGAGAPTGTVTFLDGGTSIGTGTLSGGVATFTTSALAVGNHTITTTYAGSGNFSGGSGSLAGNPQVVNQFGSATTATSSANPSVFGGSVTFKATVTAVGGTGTPTGTVTFRDGGSSIGTGTLNGSGVATFATSTLAAGNHTITASYGGNTTFGGSSASLAGNPQVVNKDGTTAAVISSANPSVFGGSVTFTATVSPNSAAGAIPTGTVAFFDGSTQVGASSLSAGGPSGSAQGAFSISLAAGSHSIAAQYGGDTNFSSSSSPIVTETINPASTPSQDFSINTSSAALSIAPGQSQSIVLTIAPLNQSTQSISFTCSGLPAKATCTFSQPTVTLDGTHSATTTATIQTASNSEVPAIRLRRIFPPPYMLVAVVCFTFLLYSSIFLQRSPRRIASSMSLLLLLGLTLASSACAGISRADESTTASGTSSGSGSPPGNYSVFVTGASSTTTHAVDISVTID